MKNKPPIPDIDPKSQAGKRLVGSVQDKLKEFLGKDYADESLAQYVVVMLAHKTQQEALASNLLEFLGDVDSKECASWVYEKLLPEYEEKQCIEAEAATAIIADATGQQPGASSQPATAAAPGQGSGDQAKAAAAPAQQAQHAAAGVGVQRQEQGRRGRGDSRERQRHKGSSRSYSRSSRSYSRSSRSYSRSSRSYSRSSSRSREHGRGRYHRSPPSGGHRHGSRDRQHRRRESPYRRDRLSSHDVRHYNGSSSYHHSSHSGRRPAYPYREEPRDPYYHHPVPVGTQQHRRSPPRRPRRGSPSPLRHYDGHQRPAAEPAQPRRLRSEVQQQQQQQQAGPRGRGAVQYGSQRQPALYEDPADEEPQQDARGGAQPAAACGVWGRLRSEVHGGPAQQQAERPWRGDSGGYEAALDYGGDEGADGQAAEGQQHQPWERPSYMDIETTEGAGGSSGSGRQRGAGRRRGGASAAAAVTNGSLEAGRRPVAERLVGLAGPASAFTRAVKQAAASSGAAEAAAPLQRRVAALAGGGLLSSGLRVTVTTDAHEQQQPNHKRRLDGEPAAVAAARSGPSVPAGPSILARLGSGGGAAGGGSGGLGALGSPLARAGASGELPSPVAGGGGGGRLQADQEALRRRMRQMELELIRLRAENAESSKTAEGIAATAARISLGLRSVCVTGLHPSATEAVLAAHFRLCGSIVRVTLIKDPATGDNSGVAWVQFSTQEAAQRALELSGSTLLQKTIVVVPKDSPASKAATARLLQRSHSFPPQPPTAAIIPVPIVPVAPDFAPPPLAAHKRRRLEGRRRSMVYVRQESQPKA